jgi:hypothetical protein
MNEPKKEASPFDVCPREQLALAMFLLGRKCSEGERRLNDRTCEAFKIVDLREALIDGDSIKAADWTSKVPALIEVPRRVEEYLIKVLGEENGGAQAVYLDRMRARLEELRDGRYQLPSSLSDG